MRQSLATVLVTGGMGYIGKAVVSVLESAGFSTVVLDNFATSRKPTDTSEFELVEGDYGDPNVLDRLNGRGIDAIIHLANSAYVGESMSDPMKYFQNNVAKTISLLDWADSQGIRKVVFSSSCATYGAPDTVLISEETEQNPINPYGESKLMIETILDWLGALRGFKYVALRYFNVAGNSHISSARDEHDPEPHLLPRLVAAARSGTEFSVFGSTFDTHDGSAVRDFIHVDDLADAHLKALQRLNADRGALKVNLGTGNGVSVLELATKVQERFGPIDLKISEARPGDPGTLVASNDLARKHLGWIPTNSSIDQILDSLNESEGLK